MSSQPTQNLTGQVRKMDQWYFTYGGFADIWKGQLDMQDGNIMTVAVKVIKGPVDNVKITRLLREIRVWSTVHHKNITPFWGISFDFDRPRTPCLVSAYYRNGDISNYVKTQPVVDKVPLITQVSSALAYMHDLNIIHGDVKPSNVLICDNGEAMIADFGLARILEVSGFTTKTGAGTYRYMAPELVDEGQDSEEGFIPRVTKATDAWALAMTVIEIFTQSKPFSHIALDANVILYVMKGGRPKQERCPSINDEIWTILERSWDIEASRRPSMTEVSHCFDRQQTPVVSLSGQLV